MEGLDFDNIPTMLQDFPQWVLWKIVDRNGKPDKLPCQANGNMAESDNPLTWTDYGFICAAFNDKIHAGIGFVFSPDDPFVGVDLDGCRDPRTGKVEDWAKELILQADSYAEVSPSQTGVKIFVQGTWIHGGKNLKLDGVPMIGDKKPGIEVYGQKRYFAVTGQRLKGMSREPEQRQSFLDDLKARFWQKTKAATVDYYSEASVIDRARKYLAKVPPAVSGERGHPHTFKIACRLVQGFGLAAGEAMMLLQEWNATCQPPWNEKELRHKLDDALKVQGPRNYMRNTPPEKVNEADLPLTPRAPSPPPGPRVSVLTQGAWDYVNMLKEGRGKLLTTGMADLDKAIGGGIDKGELVIMAARPSHGKSAVALQCVHHWTGQEKPCLIVSEEMSLLMLGKRTLQFISDRAEGEWESATVLEELSEEIRRYEQTHSLCYVAESCGTVDAACEQIDKAVKEHSIEVAVVDYAQLLKAPGKSRYEQITAVSSALRACCNRHNIILLMLCQLSRDIESRNKYIPQMSDLKETGQLEQDADVIVMGVWPYRVDPGQPQDFYQLYVTKNRNRPINQTLVEVRWEPSRQTMHDRVHKNHDPAFDAWNNS